MKTIIQMGGCGTIFFTVVLPDRYMILVCLALSAPFLLVALLYFIKKRRSPFWAFPVFLAFVLVAVVEYFFSKQTNLMVQVSIILAITWVSAIDYLIGSFRLFRRTGIIWGDWIRILWAIVYGLFVAPLVAYFPIMVLPVLVSISLEFGLGGIDNIVVVERGRFSLLPMVLSSVSGLIFALGVNASIFLLAPQLPFYFSLALACVSALICGAVFGRHVDIFKRSH